MAATNESLVFAGLELNPLLASTNAYAIEELDIGLPQKRPEWVTGADSDGQALVRDPLYGPRTITAKVRVIAASRDAVNTAVGVLTNLIEEAEKQDSGSALVWTPADSTKAITFYVLSGEVTELPIGVEAGYFANAPLLSVRFDCKPFGYGAELTSVTDDFSVNTIANYTADAGATGNVSIAGGVMQAAANLTTNNRLVRTAGVPYTDLYDRQETIKYTLGTTLAGFLAGVTLKRISAAINLNVYIFDTAGASTLFIERNIPGSTSTALTVTRLVVSTSYWLRARIEGNVVTVEHWTVAPTVTGTPAATTSVTLAGAEATALGDGVAGKAGVMFLPQQIAASLDDFVVEPNVWKSSLPLLTGTLPGVPGDVPAEGVLTVTDSAAQSRRWFEWGLEHRYYNAAAALLFDSTSLSVASLGGVASTRAGAYTAATATKRGTLSTVASGIAALLAQAHVGSYRVRVRCWPSSTAVSTRVSYVDGSGIYSSNAFVSPPVAATWVDLDLGIITVDPAVSGTQAWSARFDAKSTTAGDTIDFDTVTLIPVGEGYGKARAGYLYSAGAAVGRDEFTGIVAGTALNARVAPAGGTWATSGAVTDFAAADLPLATDETMVRSAVSDAARGRYAILGAATPTDTEAQVRFNYTSFQGFNGSGPGVVVRWTDASNHLIANVDAGAYFYLSMWVAGVRTDLASVLMNVRPVVVNTWYAIRVVVYASGIVTATLLDSTGNTLQTLRATSSVLATGGALASGKSGFVDYAGAGVAATRYYDEFTVSTPTAEPVVVYSGRTAEVRSDRAIRGDSAGVTFGAVPVYRGAYFLVPPAGSAARTSRIAARARRTDLEAAEDTNITDSLTVRAAITPRYVAVPR